jgi:hypothetical protein
MSFALENAVPWGRNYREYVAMFSLSEADLTKRILGCSDGPASFNCEGNQKGYTITSVDPLYQYSSGDIQKRIDETFGQVIEQTRLNQNEFVWKSIQSVEELGQTRMEAMKRFIDDYETHKERYVAAQLPNLPFHTADFDLALCSHFLFLYSEQFSAEFHTESIKELCRIASEVRIFPLLELGSVRSRHVDHVCAYLIENGYEFEIQKVNYEFQTGGNEMLVVRQGEALVR